jgi:hypothetical protein
MAETWSVKISQESKFSTINKRVYDQKNNKEIKFTVLFDEILLVGFPPVGYPNINYIFMIRKHACNICPPSPP